RNTRQDDRVGPHPYIVPDHHIALGALMRVRRDAANEMADRKCRDRPVIVLPAEQDHGVFGERAKGADGKSAVASPSQHLQSTIGPPSDRKALEILTLTENRVLRQ